MRPIISRFCVPIIILATLATSARATDAATEVERQLLVRIAIELEYLKSLSGKAQEASDPARRIRFDYDALISDLSEIQGAIERHAERPQRSPRSVTPLKMSSNP